MHVCNTSTRPAERCGGMVGCSVQSRALFREIRQLAGEKCPVLVLGETGTGKELVAQALHQTGKRHQPWVAINCASISETLALSELFGHEKGSFTGAVMHHKGAFERADGGTLFLDEVGELPLPLQAQLLRVLESGEFYRLGSDRALHSEFRLLAATHKDLAHEVAMGRFRQDLYFRLSVAVLEVLPLRARPDDIPQIAGELLQRDGGQGWKLDEDALGKLCSHTWPGNVRELANVLTRARLRSLGGMVRGQDISLVSTYKSYQPTFQVCDSPTPWGTIKIEGHTLLEIEREAILCTLRSCGGSQAEAARRLGLPRQTLNDRIRRLGIPTDVTHTNDHQAAAA